MSPRPPQQLSCSSIDEKFLLMVKNVHMEMVKKQVDNPSFYKDTVSLSHTNIVYIHYCFLEDYQLFIKKTFDILTK